MSTESQDDCNQKIKNIRFNYNVEEDKKILDYLKNNKVNFSRLTKRLIMEHITHEEKNNETKDTDNSIMNILNCHTKLLEEIKEKIENGAIAVTKDPDDEEYEKEESNDENGFNMEFLNQLGR